jgi:hypothetical protein
MENVIRYLYNESGQRNCGIRHLNTLVFAFDNFEISIVYSFLNEVKSKDFERLEDIDDLLKDISNINFQQFFIVISESFNDRQDYDDWNDKEKKFYIPESTNSISNSMFNLINQLTKLNKNLVLNHKVKVEDPTDEGMCGYYPQYIGEIEVDLKKINHEILEKIIEDLKSYTLVKLDNLYVPAYYNYKRPKNSFSPQFLNTNTKVRRLGYLKLFFKFINEKKKVPQSFINKKFEEFSLQFSSQLNDISNKKGVIQNLSGKSAEPYISLLKEMDLITTVNRVVVPTKWLKTYLVLRENFIDENSGAFILDKIDKMFLMEIILRKDFFYSIIILEFLFVRDTCTSQEVINNFQKLLLQRIESLIKQAAYKDEKGVSQLKEIEKRVMAWKKAEVYLEHIIMPRVNWYADLGIITLSNNVITINENGKRLLSELNSWIDIQAEYVADSTDFLKRFYPHVYAKSYFGSYGEYPSTEIIHGLVDEYITESFVLFKTLAPNRVTSSQAFTFAKYSFYFKNGFSVSESYLARIVEETFSNKYIYKFQPRYGDGYIQKIQSK